MMELFTSEAAGQGVLSVHHVKSIAHNILYYRQIPKETDIKH